MTAGQPPDQVLHDIVGLGCRAPSMYNAQPWSWRAGAGRLELHVDRSRAMPAADPPGRNLVIGCGAALHHARVAAAAYGWATDVTRLPDPDRPDLVAVLEFRAADVTVAESRMLEALQRRYTDRRRFTWWPVRVEWLARLAGAACAEGARAVPVVGQDDRDRLEALFRHALVVRGADDGVTEEQRSWLDRGDVEGISTTTVPENVGPPGTHRSRFGAGLLPQPLRELDSVDGTIVLGGRSDEVTEWLAAGEGLSALWLQAVGQGLSLIPLAQVIEVPETRLALQDEIVAGALVPYLVLLVGWHSPTLEPLPRTPRRPLMDVLLP